MSWILTVWLVVNGALQIFQQTGYGTEAECNQALETVEVNVEENVSWIAACQKELSI